MSAPDCLPLIAVAEPSPDVRELLSLVLTIAHYRVATIASAPETIADCADEEVRLLIIDTAWAGDLESTLGLIQSLRPTLAILLIGQMVEPLGALGARVSTLPKPFRPPELLARVASLTKS